MAKANVKVTLLSPIEAVWEAVTDLSNVEWRSDIREIKVIDETTFTEITKDGIETKFKAIEKERCTIWELHFENENLKGRWIGKFYRHGEKTTLDFTEEAVAKKLIFKPVIASYLRKQQKQYFRDLKQVLKCEETSLIQVL